MNKNANQGVFIIAIILAVTTIASLFWGYSSQKQIKTIKNSAGGEACELHRRTIDLLQKENDSLKEQLTGFEKLEGNAAQVDVEYFLTTFYSNTDTNVANYLNNIKALCTDEVYAELLPRPDVSVTGDVDYESVSRGDFETGVSNLKTFQKNNEDGTVETITIGDMWIKTGAHKNTSSLVFDAILKYEADKDKWVVTKIVLNEKY